MKNQLVMYNKKRSDYNNKIKFSEHVNTENNDLKIKAWLYRDRFLDRIMIYAESNFFTDNVRVIAQKKDLVVQVSIKIKINKPYYVSGQYQNSMFLRKSMYAIIKTSRLKLPEDHLYKLEYFQIIQPGLLLITLSKWNHSF